MEPSKTPLSLEVIDEAVMPDDLDRAIRELLCECFPNDTEVYAHTRAWHTSIPLWSVVGRYEGRVAAHVSIFVRTVTCGGVPVTVAGVGNFCVAPAWRGTGLSGRVMDRVMEESRGRGIEFGLLFCLPALARLYGRWGWVNIPESITMLDAAGCDAPIPAQNIAMVASPTGRVFPPGPIHLQGCDW